MFALKTNSGASRRIRTAEGELLAEATGRLRHRTTESAALPAVGDRVATAVSTAEPKASIRAIVPRRSSFARKAAGDPTKRQLVAANVDIVLLVSGLDGDFNVRRIERYLTAAADGGVTPVIVLNKADLSDDPAARVAEVRAVAGDAPIHVTDCIANAGVEAVEQHLGPGRTAAFLGSSGVGKSTLINRLLRCDRQRTQSVRMADSRGRHTTVYRELIVFVRRADGGWRRDDERHVNVLVDTADLARRLAAEGLETEVARGFDERHQMDGLVAISGVRKRPPAPVTDSTPPPVTNSP